MTGILILQGDCPRPGMMTVVEAAEVLFVGDGKLWFRHGDPLMLVTVETGCYAPDGFDYEGTWVTESPVWRASHLFSAAVTDDTKREVAKWQQNLKK